MEAEPNNSSEIFRFSVSTLLSEAAGEQGGEGEVGGRRCEDQNSSPPPHGGRTPHGAVLARLSCSQAFGVNGP